MLFRQAERGIAMGADFRVESHVADIKRKTDEAIERALEICGGLAENHAKDNLTAFPRVDTGNLRNSITHTVNEAEQEAIIGSAVQYAPYVEYGTGKYAENGGRQTPWHYVDSEGKGHYTEGMKPSHFLKSAINDNKDEYQKVLAQELQNNMH